MKFMKLGSRPDTFYTSEAVRSVASNVSSDVIIQVNGSRYLLHKFPLLSKCLHLQKLCSQIPQSSHLQTLQLPDFPGGPEAFELCAKFCYGITITISAYNIVSIRCAAEYLQMTEKVDKGNLVLKLEIFLNSCILNGWRDIIVTLQTTTAFSSWSEDLMITTRCVEAIASKVSYSARGRDEISSCNGSNWTEDLAEMGIDLYWRVMTAIKSCGKVPCNLIGDALRVYASRWLPRIPTQEEVDSKDRILLESVISLLPVQKGAVSCSFLMKLLRAANVLKASASSKTELATRVGLQLEEATVGDLLVPCLESSNGTMYDVDMFMTILEQFMQIPQTSPPRNKEKNVDSEFQESRGSSCSSHSSKLIKVAKLVDGYLQEIAKDKNLSLSKFIAIAEAVPDFARLHHDDLYKAIDTYLKGHIDLNKSERKRLCRVLDCKKLSMEACMHAAQNEMLPLRVVVQILFFEQTRASMASGRVSELPSNIKVLLAAHNETSLKPNSSFSTNSTVLLEDQWSLSGLKSTKSNLSTLRMKLAEEDDDDGLNDKFSDGIEKSSKLKPPLSATSRRPRRIFGKFWPMNRSARENKN